MNTELEQLGERIAEQAAHFDAAMHRMLNDLREFDERGGWHVQGASSCAHWLAWRVGWDLVTARERVRVARKLAEFLAIDDALRRGEISYSKVRAMVRVATPTNETLLLEYARLMTGSQLEKQCRKYALVQRHCQDPHPLDDQQRRYVRRRDIDDGMVKIEAVLHPEEAELVWTMLNHAATQLAREPEPPSSGDSAEAQASMQVHSTVGVPPSGHTYPSGDSVGSWELKQAQAMSAAPSPRQEGTCATSDSAEAQALMQAQASMQVHSAIAAPLGGLGLADTCLVNDSAEARQVNDSAEAREDGSLLDWLREEAQAGREAETVPSSDRETMRIEPVVRTQVSMLHQRADAARRAFSRADALVSLAQGYLRGDRPNCAPIEITLTIPASSLRTGEADPLEVGEIGESFVSCEAARRISCDSGVVEVIEDEHGTPLSVGRKRRTIAGALKRALYKRDKTCTYPGCTHRIFLEGHHIQHWADGGETSLMNTALLCSAHHRHVHEYGYTIELGPDQRPLFRDPHGWPVAAVPERPMMADLGWPWIRAANEALAIDADTIACEWDGKPVDYGAIVGHLVVADGLK